MNSPNTSSRDGHIAALDHTSLHDRASLSFGVSLLVLLAIWAVVVVIVDPRGEFMVNDDWCYVKALQELFSHGRLPSTGWGPAWAPGGPSLFIHLMWGHVFTFFGGFSLTTLRLSVLAAGMLGSLALLVLLRAANVSRQEALWGTVTLVLNPLFLSQCFTFMSDITFTALVSFSLWFMFLGVRSGRTWVLVVALLFSLASVLTRQIGMVVPLAFLGICFLHPRGWDLGRARMALLVCGIVMVPWLMYESLLAWIGSTPITDHQVIKEIWRGAASKGFFGYAASLYFRLVHAALPFTCIFVSPVLALRYRWLWAHRSFRWFCLVVTCVIVMVEALLIAGLIHPAMQGLRNVIYNVGIGPILLKDVYIMAIQRGPALSTAEYFVLVYGSLLSIGAFVALAMSSLSRLLGNRNPGEIPIVASATGPESRSETESAAAFIASVSLVSALLYLGVITLTGFHDRYLVPVCLFLVVWLVLDRPLGLEHMFPLRGVLLGMVPLVVFGLFSVTATADFMALKRVQKQALDFVEQDLKIKPCEGDGGMEYNGYHCYDRDFTKRPGLSWWWVVKEDYLVTLGPIQGYEIVRTFPFSRYIGAQAAIHVLKPLPCQK